MPDKGGNRKRLFGDSKDHLHRSKTQQIKHHVWPFKETAPEGLSTPKTVRRDHAKAILKIEPHFRIRSGLEAPLEVELKSLSDSDDNCRKLKERKGLGNALVLAHPKGQVRELVALIRFDFRKPFRIEGLRIRPQVS